MDQDQVYREVKAALADLEDQRCFPSTESMGFSEEDVLWYFSCCLHPGYLC